jgi:hypothetical protein
MPRYYFDVVDGQRLVDPAGVDCATDDAATLQAEAIASQIATDLPGRAAKRRVEVLNDDGREVTSVAVGDQHKA